jgi:hypothetical protein
MVLQGRQNMKKSIYLGPFQNKFLFLFWHQLIFKSTKQQTDDSKIKKAKLPDISKCN